MLHPANATQSYKIIFLSLVKTHETFTAAKDYLARKNQVERESIKILSALWYPKPPRYQDVALGSILPRVPTGPFSPLVNMDFGGPGGVLLQSLTRLIVHVAHNRYPIVGMEFRYGDESVRFGGQGSVQITTLIDGPAGERIQSVDIITDPAGAHIMGLWVSLSPNSNNSGVNFTNHGYSSR